jgi:type I restriction enzyme S subunit
LKNIPSLRFPEFNDKWGFRKIKEILTIGSGKDYKHLGKGNVPVFGTGGLMTMVNSFLHDGETVCIGRKGTIDKPMYFNGKIWTVDTLFYTHSYIESNPKFVFNLFQKVNWKQHNEAGGVPSLSKSTIENISLCLPSLPEQQKIASFLSAVDEKIQQLNRKKELLEQYKKGVMQQFFSGKLRFKDENGEKYADWKLRKMNEVLFEHKLNSTGKEEVFSVSVHKGLINQIEHLGRVFAAKNTDNYNLVKPGDIVYTKSPTGSFPLGIIKQSKVNKDVIVSPLYGIFTPETQGLGYMLNVYFESPINVNNYLASIIQKGAKNTINITNTTFLSKKMKLPVSKEEQNKIGNFLEQIDSKIESTTQQITQTQTFKKGLLQMMFVKC